MKEAFPANTAKAFLALSLAKSGQRGEAIKLRDQLKLESPHRYVPSYCFAILHIALDEKDEARVAGEGYR